MLRKPSAALPDRPVMYCSPSANVFRSTSPPCFWKAGTAAGAVLKTRHGALPAVIAAPITSSDDLPAGMACAVTCWSACWAFQAWTTFWAQAISCWLVEVQTVIGPVFSSAVVPPDPPDPHAASGSITAEAAATATARVRRLIALSPHPGRNGPLVPSVPGVAALVPQGARPASTRRSNRFKWRVSRSLTNETAAFPTGRLTCGDLRQPAAQSGPMSTRAIARHQNSGEGPTKLRLNHALKFGP